MVENKNKAKKIDLKKICQLYFLDKEAKKKWWIFLGLISLVFLVHFGLYIANKTGHFDHQTDNWIGIDTIYNPGTAYGLIQSLAVVFLIEIALSLLLFVSFLLTFKKLFYVPLACIFAGGLANLINRAINPNEGVFDYFRLNLNRPLLNFTANFPDIVIFIGAVWLVITIIITIFSEIKTSRSQKEKNKGSSDKNSQVS